jgi:DNA-binding CsgD family transcriptional regulator
MNDPSRSEQLLIDLQRDAYEVVSLENMGGLVLPSLERAVGACAGFIYRSTEEQPMLPVADDSPLLVKGYLQEYFDGDPFHEAFGRADMIMTVVSRMPEWKLMLRHPLYGEYCPKNDIAHFLHIRLTPTPHLEPGSMNVMLFRTSNHSDFSDRELVTAARALPALEAAARRCLQNEADRGPAPVVEAILDEADDRAHLALTPQGRLLWRSQRAARLLDSNVLPEALVTAARELGVLARGQSPRSLPSTVSFTRRDGTRVTGDLHLSRARTGEPFVAVALSTRSRPRVDELRERFGLTQAEADVLGELALGHSNREIARRRSVSVATVRTHVVHLLQKLGVHSRLRAALMVTSANDD